MNQLRVKKQTQKIEKQIEGRKGRNPKSTFFEMKNVV